MDFDETRLYYSHQALQSNQGNDADNNDNESPNDGNDLDDEDFDAKAVRRHFREFLSKYHTKPCQM